MTGRRNVRADPRTAETGFAPLTFTPNNALKRHAGPALLADRFGDIVAANAAATALVAALREGALPALAGRMARVATDGLPHSEKVEVPGTNGGQALEVSLIPHGHAPDDVSVLLLARDVTADRNLTQALVASRQLFKDLVTCSSDFAWETKADGTFSFVSPRGALGYTAHELAGKPARGLIDRQHPIGGLLPFGSDLPVYSVELWVKRKDGKSACLLVSSVPVLDDDGHRLGARGVCRDVTLARERDMALERARNRERLQNRLIDTIRNEVDPRRMLTVAAESIAGALAAAHCWVYLRGEDRALKLAADYGGIEGVPVESEIDAQIKDAKSNPGPYELSVAGTIGLTMPSVCHDVVNGAICVSRAAAQPFDDDARLLLAGVADHLGIAIEQVLNLQKLERISRTDELTGLFNRRAFFEEVNRRHQHLRRVNRQGALLYVDLDNFKQVNDVHGHQRGDAALRVVADILRKGSRIADMQARLGGDEFALWLEEVDEAGAIAKARALLQASHLLRPLSGAPDRPLGFSVGIAVSALDRPETVQELVARADEAMYRAKRSGKGNFALTRPGEDTSHARAEAKPC
jgi:diguanylate cyclase (GGDEF)-like protein/PAS domain S-box-containing protein